MARGERWSIAEREERREEEGVGGSGYGEHGETKSSFKETRRTQQTIVTLIYYIHLAISYLEISLFHYLFNELINLLSFLGLGGTVSPSGGIS